MCCVSVGSWRRGVDGHLVALAGEGERRLAFEIEVLLAADGELALKPMRRGGDRGLGVAAPEGVVVLHPRAGCSAHRRW